MDLVLLQTGQNKTQKGGRIYWCTSLKSLEVELILSKTIFRNNKRTITRIIKLLSNSLLNSCLLHIFRFSGSAVNCLQQLQSRILLCSVLVENCTHHCFPRNSRKISHCILLHLTDWMHIPETISVAWEVQHTYWLIIFLEPKPIRGDGSQQKFKLPDTGANNMPAEKTTRKTK